MCDSSKYNPIPNLTSKDLDRFWKKVDKGSKRECWEWTAGTRKPTHYDVEKGYGCFWINPRNYCAHRISYKLEYGVIDNDLMILHHCDNPPCVNPNHLFQGTAEDNSQDAIQKGRWEPDKLAIKGYKKARELGKTIGKQKINANEARKIYKRFHKGETARKLALKFPVSDSQILRIAKRRSWKKITKNLEVDRK